jgi:uncharacterized glyoxalase superfamily protein PhnB
MNQSKPTPTFCSRIAYKELRNAVDWLEQAFGFTTATLATGADGKVVYAEIAFGNGLIQIGSEWENIHAPSSLGGANTQTRRRPDSESAACKGAPIDEDQARPLRV